MKPDNSSCLDIDECSQANACSADATCANTDGSYTCSCNEGFTGNGIVCERMEVCLYVPGVQSCSCRPGMVTSGNACVDIDECKNKTACWPNAQCQNTFGSFTCFCNENYTAVGQSCKPACRSVPCPSDPCVNGGACYVDGVDGGCSAAKCSCTPVTQGDKCQFGTLTVPVSRKPGAAKVKYALKLWFISKKYNSITEAVKAELTNAVINKLKIISGFNAVSLENFSSTGNSTIKSNCMANFDYPLDSSIHAIYNGTQLALIRSKFVLMRYLGNILLEDIQQTVVPQNQLDQVYNCNTTFTGYTLSLPETSGPVCLSPCANENHCNKNGECQHLQTGAVCVCNNKGIYQTTGSRCEEVTLISRVFFAILFGTLGGILLLLLLAGLLGYMLYRRKKAWDRFSDTGSLGTNRSRFPSFSRKGSYIPWITTMPESTILSDASGIKTLSYRENSKPDPHKEVRLPRATAFDNPAMSQYE
ncbi:mucin-4-like [Lethenteron reissneri]|nr:mucin-4-like [Lethenteron reissneri]